MSRSPAQPAQGSPRLLSPGLCQRSPCGPPVVLPGQTNPCDAAPPRPAPLRSLQVPATAPGSAGRPAQAATQRSRALERAGRRPAHHACRPNLPPVGRTSLPQQAGGSSAGVTQLLGLCLGHRHHMSLLGDFRMREARIKAATRWSPTTATSIRHKGTRDIVPWQRDQLRKGRRKPPGRATQIGRAHV